jgi:hypothetical protein
VLASRDTGFLAEEIAMQDNVTRTVAQALSLAYQTFTDTIGVGEVPKYDLPGTAVFSPPFCFLLNEPSSSLVR